MNTIYLLVKGCSSRRNTVSNGSVWIGALSTDEADTLRKGTTMDPVTTLRMCKEEISNENWLPALYHLLHYYHWRIGRGHEPYLGDKTAMEYETTILGNLTTK